MISRKFIVDFFFLFGKSVDIFQKFKHCTSFQDQCKVHVHDYDNALGNHQFLTT